jgi:predicted Na+-dependent transporter
MLKIVNAISSKYLSFILIAGIFIGIFLPAVSDFVQPYILYFFMGIFFLNYMKLDFDLLRHEIKKWRYQLYLIFMVLIIVPLLSYFVATVICHYTILPKEFSMAFLMAFAAPTGAATPTLCLIMNGKLERTILNVIGTSIFVPLTFPLLLYIFLHKQVEIDFQHLASFLSMVIFAPMALAFIVRKTFTKSHKFLASAIIPLSVVLLFFVMIGFVAGIQRYFFLNTTTLLYALLFSFLIIICILVVSWFLAFKKSFGSRVTASIIAAWPNVGLAIITAQLFFKNQAPMLLVYLVLIGIVLLLLIAPLQLLVNKAQKR